MDIRKRITARVKGITGKDVFYGTVIIALAGMLAGSLHRLSSEEEAYKNNVAALNDTIRYHRTADGDLVADRLSLVAGYDVLKTLNDSLYLQLESMRGRHGKKADVAVSVKSVAEAPHDSAVWRVEHDTVQAGFSRRFTFGDRWYTLEGHVDYGHDSLHVGIDRNMMDLPYTVSMDGDNMIHVTSPNPYVRYNEISGFRVPEKKVKRWSIGPVIGGGVGNGLKLTPFVGVGITYGIVRF